VQVRLHGPELKYSIQTQGLGQRKSVKERIQAQDVEPSLLPSTIMLLFPGYDPRQYGYWYLFLIMDIP